MQGKVFQSVTNKNGLMGLRCNFRPEVALIGYKSPYASARQNDWLEKRLIKVYSIYYYKVLLSTYGRFWEESRSTIGLKHEEDNGGTSNDIQLQKFIGR